MYNREYSVEKRKYEVGDSVIIFYKQLKNKIGFISDKNRFRHEEPQYKILNYKTFFHRKRVRGYRVILLEKSIFN